MAEKAEQSGLLTYGEWNAKGRRIHKGTKARGFRDGQALFAEEDTYDPSAWRRVSAMLGAPEPGEWSDPPH